MFHHWHLSLASSQNTVMISFLFWCFCHELQLTIIHLFFKKKKHNRITHLFTGCPTDLLNVRHTVAPVRLGGVVYLLNSAELLWAAVIRAGAAATLPSLPSVFWGVPSSEDFSAGLHLTTSPMHGCNLRFLFLFPTTAAQVMVQILCRSCVATSIQTVLSSPALSRFGVYIACM